MTESTEDDIIRLNRDVAGIQSLLSAALPGSPDLYTLVPARIGFKAKSQRRSDVFPQPALTATELARRLQQWLQDELIATQDVISSPEEVKLGIVAEVPTISISREDICTAATEGHLINCIADEAYHKHCVRRFGVKIVRPDELYGWASESTDFWAAETFIEFIRCTENVYLTASDLRSAADQVKCPNHAAQLYLDAQSLRQMYLVASKNYTAREMRRVEQQGPYYTWKPTNESVTDVVPWEGVASGVDFAYRLNHAFSSGKLSPSIIYTSCTGEEAGLPYIDQLPELPDEAMVERLSRGECPLCDAAWKFCIVRVPVYVWVVEPKLPATELSKEQSKTLLFVPDMMNRYTAPEMAEDISFYLHVETDVDNMLDIVRRSPPRDKAVRHAWRKVQSAAYYARCNIFIHEV